MSASILDSHLLCKTIRSLSFFVLSLALVAAFAADQAHAESKQIALSWNYNNAAAPDLAGFRIYQNQRLLCQTTDLAARQLSCMAELIYESNEFTITAFDKHNNESDHSLPWYIFYQGPDVIAGDIGFEAGEVFVNHNWQRIPFGRFFNDPVIVAPALSQNGCQPALVRIRNVTNSGFEIRIQEWDYLDGKHARENVGYLVMERGVYILPGGVQVEAGRFVTSSDTTDVVETIPFMNPGFIRVPVVMTSVVSENDAGAVIGRLARTFLTKFGFALQVEKAKPKYHPPETISYIAWEPTKGKVGSLWYQVGKTANAVNHLLTFIPFGGDTNVVPIFLGGIRTANDWDPATLRWQEKTGFGVSVQVAEEQSLTKDTSHALEGVGYMLFR